MPDCNIPRDAIPRVTGDRRCRLTEPLPADSPNIVIRFGSPPKFFALFFNHWIASA